MTDWKALAAARCPDIPADAVARTLPGLEALEAAFVPLAAGLTAEDESAVTFANVQERGAKHHGTESPK
jgi:hypothetical protein